MNGTVTGIIIICAVVVVSLAVWLALVARASRRPGGKKGMFKPADLDGFTDAIRQIACWFLELIKLPRPS